MAPERTKRGKGKGMQEIAKHEESAKVFEFLKLPAELRNMIYWHALVKKHSCYRFGQPPLTQVNKQIRSESLPVLYGNGLFFAYFGPYFPIPERFRKLPRLVPAIPNLSHITKLDIRFSFGTLGFSRERGVDVFIYMRADKLECASLGNDNLIGQPDLDWRYQGRIARSYRHRLKDISVAGASWRRYAVLSAQRGMSSVVRTMLCFAQRCPAATEWVWMVLEMRDL